MYTFFLKKRGGETALAATTHFWVETHQLRSTDLQHDVRCISHLTTDCLNSSI